MTEPPAGNASDYLAAERTFLAWIRTGLALMGFGFVVARFGLFLEALQINQPNIAFRSVGLSPWFGTALILLGIVVNISSAWNHVRFVRFLNRGERDFRRPSGLAITVAIQLSVIGLAMAFYLISVRKPGEARMERFQENPMSSTSENGIVTIPARESVDQTVHGLEALLEAKGIKLFALIDHSGEAEKAGLQMRPTKLVVFGNPKAGTSLMIASPLLAIDLPLKILVWEGADGKVWISYNSPTWLQARHNLASEMISKTSVVEALAKQVAE